MDELEKILTIVGKHGWQPILSAVLLLLVLRLGKPEIIAPAVGTLYADFRRAVGTWWESHRELVEAQRDRARAQEARDRALEVAWSTDQAGARTLDRLVHVPISGGRALWDTGERGVMVQQPREVGSGDTVDPVGDVDRAIPDTAGIVADPDDR